MKPLDLIVWGIERADGTLRSPVGIPLLWRHESAAAEFGGAGATDRPVRLRITRADEPAALPKRVPKWTFDPSDVAEPEPVSREEFEALRECVATLADVVDDLCFGSPFAVREECHRALSRIAALRKGKEASDGS